MRKFLFRILLKAFALPASNVPIENKGTVIILLDGLGHKVFEDALKSGKCKFFKSLLKTRYSFAPYYCGPPASTTATESELFFGTRDNIPGFTWYDRKLSRFVRGNRGEDIDLFEKSLASSEKLLNNGSCIFGVYSAGATLCNLSGKDLNFTKPFLFIKKLNLLLFIFVNPVRFGLAMYLLLKSIFSSLFVILKKKSMKRFIPMMKDSLSYTLVGNTITYLAELEIARETPILFIDYVLYDEFAHAYGISSKTSQSAIRLIDWYCKSIYQSAKSAKREYDVIILSDHGQTPSRPFETSTRSLEQFFSQILSDPNRNIVKTYGGFDMEKIGRDKDVYLVPAGSTIQVYFAEHLSSPLMKEILDLKYPHLIRDLLKEKEIGWILIRNKSDMQTLYGKNGSVTFANGRVLEVNKTPFGTVTVDSHTMEALATYARFENNGDLVLFGNVAADGKIYSFEEHLGTHGGFYGEMVHPFVMTENKRLIEILSANGDMAGIFRIIRSSRPKN